MQGKRKGAIASDDPIRDLRDLLKAEASRLSKIELSTGEWWTVAGYASIVDKCQKALILHEARARRVYGARAPFLSYVIRDVLAAREEREGASNAR